MVEVHVVAIPIYSGYLVSCFGCDGVQRARDEHAQGKGVVKESLHLADNFAGQEVSNKFFMHRSLGPCGHGILLRRYTNSTQNTPYLAKEQACCLGKPEVAQSKSTA